MHRDHREVRIPNPNVHLEYGLMLAFKKHILPFQREGDALASLIFFHPGIVEPNERTHGKLPLSRSP